MKYLLGIFACLVIVVTVVAAQQEAPPKTTPSIQPTAEALLKAQAAADKAQTKHEEASTEELKKLVEREIAKSAALPVTTTVQQTINPPVLVKDQNPGFRMVVIDGVVYLRMGNSIVPMIGSGCFLTQEERDTKLQRAQAKFAEMKIAEPAKTEPVKPSKKD